MEREKSREDLLRFLSRVRGSRCLIDDDVLSFLYGQSIKVLAVYIGVRLMLLLLIRAMAAETLHHEVVISILVK